jgi:hypothetical protein
MYCRFPQISSAISLNKIVIFTAYRQTIGLQHSMPSHNPGYFLPSLDRGWMLGEGLLVTEMAWACDYGDVVWEYDMMELKWDVACQCIHTRNVTVIVFLAILPHHAGITGLGRWNRGIRVIYWSTFTSHWQLHILHSLVHMGEGGARISSWAVHSYIRQQCHRRSHWSGQHDGQTTIYKI